MGSISVVERRHMGEEARILEGGCAGLENSKAEFRSLAPDWSVQEAPLGHPAAVADQRGCIGEGCH